ncbi:hypothetical protein [Rugamonas aquatica]|uniref:Uncharacterized protein n=1 Tax=Rugamonas aquatica TaxID=2743357 RepID=A0A6A7N1H6_9BURK|nr:hypothetical protein [Rugamonas aquatica]MQA38893.1 hypothetical protein [Rugamonas aquatica]
MIEFAELSQDEKDLVTRFRNGNRIDRARIVLATHKPDVELSEEELRKLRTFAAYLECNEYGRARCLEAMEIFAAAPSVEEAHAKLAEIDAARARSNVIDISAGRP